VRYVQNVTDIDDAKERERRSIGRPSKAEPFRSVVAEILAITHRPTFIRIGSCGALHPGMELGDLVISTGAAPGGITSWSCSVTRSGVTCTVVTRGYDGTSSVNHAAGASCAVCLTSVDLDEANLADPDRAH